MCQMKMNGVQRFILWLKKNNLSADENLRTQQQHNEQLTFVIAQRINTLEAESCKLN